jgi:RNA polymerase sigma factor (sigma-70 family)
MTKEWSPTQEAFNNLLAWLDKDRNRAGYRYEEIRRNLIRIFARRGCPIAEDLTDETINRVTEKAVEIAPSYVGDPGLYFYRVARNVYLEYVKKQPNRLPIPPSDPIKEKEDRLNCLDHCLENLDASSRDLILAYYSDEKRAKIDNRKELAARLGITINTVRMRAHRIKITLQECVGDCLMKNQVS